MLQPHRNDIFVERVWIHPSPLSGFVRTPETGDWIKAYSAWDRNALQGRCRCPLGLRRPKLLWTIWIYRKRRACIHTTLYIGVPLWMDRNDVEYDETTASGRGLQLR